MGMTGKERIVKVAILAMCASLLLGNSVAAQAENVLTPKHVAVTYVENDSLLPKIESLEKQISGLTARLSFDEDLLSSKQDVHTTVVLDPAKLHVYQELDANPLQFLVSLESVAPYLNGYKLIIDVGNPTTARFHGATIICKWNKAYDWRHYSQESYKAWQAAIHTSQTNVTNEIDPGSWNPIEIDLLPATQDELEYLTVSIQSDTISLTNN